MFGGRSRLQPVCVRSAYHGHVSSLIDISPYKHHQLADAALHPSVHVVSAAPGAVHVSAPPRRLRKRARRHVEATQARGSWVA